MNNLLFRVWCDNKMETVGAIDWGSRWEVITCNTETRKLYIGADEFIIMQYSDIKDRNDTLVCEGDVIKVCGKKEKPKLVVRENGGFMLAGGKGSMSYHPLYDLIRFGRVFDVIGNIYENPGLVPHD